MAMGQNPVSPPVQTSSELLQLDVQPPENAIMYTNTCMYIYIYMYTHTMNIHIMLNMYKNIFI